MAKSNPLKPIPTPKLWPDANARLVIGEGAPIDPIVRLSTFSPEQFENFTNQWIFEYLKKQYDTVEERHGAGDKGRDIVAWVEPKGTKNRAWDNYQCKHYGAPLRPTNVYVELGKLCFYTFNKIFTVPRKYYFVCNNGVGTKLADLLQKPDDLRAELIANWSKYCEKEITSTQDVLLTGAFRAYIDKFDFGIVDYIAPLKMLEMHSQTTYHPLVFGTTLKARPAPLLPPKKVDKTKEHRYVEQLFDAYSDHVKASVSKVSELSSHSNDLLEHYHDSRKCFYSAESLKEFARDNLPANQDYFADLTDRILSGIKTTIRKPHTSGYVRLLSTVETAHSLQIGQHVLSDDLLPDDREGICHQLANADKIKWVT